MTFHSLCLLLYQIQLHQVYVRGDECIPQCPRGKTLWFKDDEPVLVYNGCGASGMSFTSDVLDICCMEHDACFKICGTTAQECNQLFRDCVDERCHGRNRYKTKCRFMQSVGHKVIDVMGCHFHYKEQEKYCKCLSYTETKKKLGENVKWFYEKANYNTNTRGSLINRRLKYLSADIGHGNGRAIDWFLNMVQKYPYKLIRYNGESTMDVIKGGWSKVKQHSKNGVKALKKKVKSGWKAVKRGWKSLFGAHDLDGLYDEYENENEDKIQDLEKDNNAQNVNAFMREPNVEMAESDEIFVLMLIVLLTFVTLCGFIGCVCGFVVASIATKPNVQFLSML